MKENNTIHNIGYILLAIFLIAIHTQLMYWLQPDFIDGKGIEFSWLRITEKTFQAELFGALFGMITVIVISAKKANAFYKIFVITVAILDGAAVFYANEADLLPEIKMLFASVHYSVYTLFIILVYGLIPKKRKEIASNEINNISEIANKLREAENYDRERMSEILMPGKDFNPDTLEYKIEKGFAAGMKGNEIAKELGISESKVSRIKNKLAL